ncbi:MAG: hypothetical protein ABIF11_08015 [Nitrospirota bacterium]
MVNVIKSYFPIFVATALLSKLKHISISQLFSLLIKISELNPDFDNLIPIIYERCSFFEQLPNLSRWLTDKNIQQAKEKAQRWLQNGIFVLIMEENQQIFFAQGNQDILNFPTATILNSRKIRSVRPTDQWLQVTIRLTQQAIEENFTIVSSLGMLTYEIVTFMAKKQNSKIIIILDGYLPGVLSLELQNAFYSKFNNMFDLKNTLFVSPFLPEIKLPSRPERLAKRDYWVVTLAKHLFIAEVRANGNIQKLAIERLSKDQKIMVFRPIKFDCNTRGNQKLLTVAAKEIIYNDIDQSIPPEFSKEITLSQRPLVDLSQYLFHYTRACPSPWPGQLLAEYIQSLLENESNANHTSFDTLCRILKEKLIRANNRFVRVKTPIVSFTVCLPTELNKIRKWNSALIRWTFEPYGIGIRKSVLEKMGVKSVIYAAEDEFKKLVNADQFRFQLHQPPKTNWSLEKEWRIQGDINLSHISLEDIVIIVSTHQEAEIVHKQFSLSVILASYTSFK